uniref:Uncharacterized protein n=1 Tax=Pithovirus LCPAC201 TaxID=2506591 RepID=A0A481Z533_9VIRU|nr:MAG: hypothetical protein LCPAC201_03040 [Pithovirus LCPAC201]
MDQEEQKPKIDNSKFSNPDGYVLVVVNDMPYHEGVEYWFDSDLQKLINLTIEEWDWMGTGETCLGRFKYGQKAYIIEDILPLSEEEGEKFGSFDPELYPPIETEDTYESVYFCLSCERFQSSSGECPNCQSKLHLAGDGSIPLY